MMFEHGDVINNMYRERASVRTRDICFLRSVCEHATVVQEIYMFFDKCV